MASEEDEKDAAYDHFTKPSRDGFFGEDLKRIEHARLFAGLLRTSDNPIFCRDHVTNILQDLASPGRDPDYSNLDESRTFSSDEIYEKIQADFIARAKEVCRNLIKKLKDHNTTAADAERHKEEIDRYLAQPEISYSTIGIRAENEKDAARRLNKWVLDARLREDCSALRAETTHPRTSKNLSLREVLQLSGRPAAESTPKLTEVN